MTLNVRGIRLSLDWKTYFLLTTKTTMTKDIEGALLLLANVGGHPFHSQSR